MRALWLMPLLIAAVLQAQAPQPNGAGLEPGALPDRWATAKPALHGNAGYLRSRVQPQLLMLRQTPCTDYEKPFIYLIFDRKRRCCGIPVRAMRSRGSGRPPHRPVGESEQSRRHSAHRYTFASSQRSRRRRPAVTDRPDTTFVKPDLGSLKAFSAFKTA